MSGKRAANPELSRRKFFRLTSSGLVATSLGAMAGCLGGGDGSDGGDGTTRLNVGIRREARTLHPSYATVDTSSFQIVREIFDSYAYYDYEDNEIKPELLTDWEWTDDTTLEGTVREGVQFHDDNGELTAEDMAYKTNRIVDEGLPSIWMYTNLVDSAEVVDDYVVRWNFTQPFIPFEANVIATSCIEPKSVLEETDDDTFARNPIGTGPFKFVEWEDGSHILLEKNENYWRDGYPYVDEILFTFVPEASTQLNMLRTGEVDIIDRARYDDLEEIQNNSDLQLVSASPGLNFDYISVGGSADDREDLKDPDVRKAINYAVNRNAIVENAYNGHAEPDDDPIPSTLEEAQIPGDEIQVYPNEPNLEMAREHLDQAGYDTIEAELLHDAQTEKVRMAQIIESNLSEIGINLELNQIDGTTLVDRLGEGSFEMALSDITLGSPDVDSTIYHFLLSDGASNRIGYENEEIDAMLNEQRAANDPEERGQIVRNIVETFLNDNPGYVYTDHHDLPRAMHESLELDRTLAPQEHLLDLWHINKP